MRGTVEAGKPRDIIRTQPTNLISTPPCTYSPSPLIGAQRDNAPPLPPSNRLCGTHHPRTPVNPPPPAPTHAPLRVCWGHPERGAVQPERRTARGCTASAVSSHARKGWRTRGRGRTGKGGAQPRERPHANGGVCARGWCSPAFLQRREDVRAGYDATRARAARETEGGGHSLRTLAPSKST
ncbi:hypothetical protein BJY52DRAFT_1278926 [Lactarius psammicola]|nr:hypothetical protein BJY52DRAFT_1278926 [Lactarius psammicola]